MRESALQKRGVPRCTRMLIDGWPSSEGETPSTWAMPDVLSLPSGRLVGPESQGYVSPARRKPSEHHSGVLSRSGMLWTACPHDPASNRDRMAHVTRAWCPHRAVCGCDARTEGDTAATSKEDAPQSCQGACARRCRERRGIVPLRGIVVCRKLSRPSCDVTSHHVRLNTRSMVSNETTPVAMTRAISRTV